MRNSIALAVGALMALPVAAAAQDAVQQTAVDCLCVLSAKAGPEAGSGVAGVQDVRGQVLLSDSVGYTPIKSSAQLSVGDRVILLSDGQAALSAGPTCQVMLEADSIINLLPTETGVCVAHASTAQEKATIEPTAARENGTVIQPTADLPPPFMEAQPQPVDYLPALAGAALFAGGVAAIILLTDGDGDGPPASP